MTTWEDEWREAVRDLRRENLGPVWIDQEPQQWTEIQTHGNLLPCEPGGRARAEMMLAIARARSKIAAQSFLIGDSDLVEALLKAASRGVRVYILTTENVTDDLSDASEFTIDIRERHKAILNRLAGNVLLRAAPHFHAKYLLVDPEEEDSAGFLSTANFNKEALTENRELVVRLTSEEVGEAFHFFARTFWGESTHELLEPEKFHTVRQLDAHVDLPRRTGIRATAKGIRTLREDVDRLIKEGNAFIVTAWGFTAKHPTVAALAQRARDGATVTVMMPARHQNSEAADVLARAGATVVATGRGHGKLHAKAIVAATDSGPKVLVMTANFDRRGLDEGSEVGLVVTGSRAEAAAAIVERWVRDAQYRYIPTANVGDVNGKALLLRDRNLVEAAVGGELTVELPAQTPASLLALRAEPRLPPIDIQRRAEIPHLERFHWQVRIPRLPPGAQEEGERVGFQLYTAKGKRWLVVDSPARMGDAKLAARQANATLVAPPLEGPV